MSQKKVGAILVIIGAAILYLMVSLPRDAQTIVGMIAYIPLILGFWILWRRLRNWASR